LRTQPRRLGTWSIPAGLDVIENESFLQRFILQFATRGIADKADNDYDPSTLESYLRR